MVLEIVFGTRILWLMIQQEGAGPPLSAVKDLNLCGIHFIDMFYWVSLIATMLKLRGVF